MFRRIAQRSFQRSNSHGSAPYSKHLKEDAFKGQYDKAAGEAYINNLKKKTEHSSGITDLWKKITYFIALPAVFLTAIPVTKVELEHAKHREHLRDISDDEWPTQYLYQNIRNKKFFWGDGDKTLFWNPDVNRHIES